MGLTQEDLAIDRALCALTQLTATELVGLTVVAAMSPSDQEVFARRVDEAWDANLAAIRQADASLDGAKAAYATACDRFGEVLAPLRRRMLLGQLTDDEAGLIDAETEKVNAAYAAKVEAADGVKAAKARFKAGVTAEQIGA